MNQMNTAVDLYFSNIKNWHKEVEKLRTIVLDCGLTEDLKWRVPCYSFQKSNIVLIHTFKEYCALLFFKGLLLNDANNLLIQQTGNVQSARQIRFTNMNEIMELESILNIYILEAIDVEKAGLKVFLKDSTAFEIAIEFQEVLDTNQRFKTAFETLTPGRQNAYKLYFSAPKQSKTRESRVKKYLQQIINGKGLYDCTCGLSKKMPACDGSHKYINKK